MPSHASAVESAAAAPILPSNRRSGSVSPAHWVLVGIFVVAATVFCIIPVRNQLRHGTTKDYPLWLDTGSRELHGVTPYYFDPVHHEFPFMYPPGAAGLLAPLSVGGKLPLMVLLVLINTVAWATCIVVPVLLLGGDWRAKPLVLFWAPALICVVYVIDTFLEGQVAMLLCALLLGMFWCLRRGWNAGGGLLLAVGASVKAFPILAVPYLIYRGYWKALAWTVVFLAVLLLGLPSVFRGPSGAWADLKTWSMGMPSNYTPEMIGQRKERSFTWQNGSLVSVANRLLRPVVADRDPEWHTAPLYVNFADLRFAVVNRIIVGVGLGLCVAYLLLMPRGRKRTVMTDAVEMSMLLILIVMFTPLSFTYNNSWLMPGIAVILYWLGLGERTRGERVLGIVWLVVAVGLLFCTVRVPALRWVRAVGNTFWADVLVLGELSWVMVVERGRSRWAPSSEGGFFEVVVGSGEKNVPTGGGHAATHLGST